MLQAYTSVASKEVAVRALVVNTLEQCFLSQKDVDFEMAGLHVASSFAAAAFGALITTSRPALFHRTVALPGGSGLRHFGKPCLLVNFPSLIR